MSDERDRGDGRVWLQPRSRFYAYCFYLDGTRYRGSTGETDRQRAGKVLQKKRAEILRGDIVPHEDKLMLRDLFKLLEGNYELRRNRSIDSMRYSFKHLREYFGDSAKVTKLGARLDGHLRSLVVAHTGELHRCLPDLAFLHLLQALATPDILKF